MNLNLVQLQALKSYVEANYNGVYEQSTADALNQILSPNFWVFRTSVGTDLARSALDWDEVLHATTGLTTRQQWGFGVLLHNGTFDPSGEQTRDGFVAIFPGAAFANTRAALLAASVRLATEGESIFASGATGPGGGDGSAMTQAALLGEGAEGQITVQNLVDAANT